MSKTKFIKVNVEDKPEKEGFYFNLSDTGKQIGYFDGNGFNEPFINSTHYLIEVPDREEEMREMLEKVLNQHNEFPLEPMSGDIIDKITELLNK